MNDAIGTSFDVRNVRYEDIHAIREDDFDVLARMAAIEPGLRVLDCGCGYGACTREILKRLRSNDAIEVDLLDQSEPQLSRSVPELATWNDDRRVVFRRIHTRFPEGLAAGARYDRVIAKMMIHENPAHSQSSIVKAIHDHLRPNGVAVIWDLSLSDSTAELFRQVVRAKDDLVGYKTLLRDRHFPTTTELLAHVHDAGLSVVGEPHIFYYEFDAQRRLHCEFRSDRKRYDAWLATIHALAEQLSDEQRTELRYVEKEGTICFRVKKTIVAAARRSSSSKWLLNTIAHSHLGHLPNLSPGTPGEDVFPQQLFEGLVLGFLPTILPVSQGLIRASLLRPGGSGKYHLKFLPGLDYVYGLPAGSHSVDRQFRAFLAYVATAYVGGQQADRVGIGGALSKLFTDFTGTAVVRFDLSPATESECVLSARIDAPPKLYDVRGTVHISSAVLSSFEKLCHSVMNSGFSPHLDSVDPPRDGVSRLRVRHPASSASHTIDDAALQVPNRVEELEPLFATLLGCAQWEIRASVSQNDARYLERLNTFFSDVPTMALAAYLHGSGTPHALYLCPATLLTHEPGHTTRRVEEGSLCLILSDYISDDSLEPLKMVAARLWSGLSQQRAASTARALEVEARNRVIASTVYKIGHPLKDRTGPLRSTVDQIAELVANKDYGMLDELSLCKIAGVQTKRVEQVGEVLDLLARATAERLGERTFVLKKHWWRQGDPPYRLDRVRALVQEIRGSEPINVNVELSNDLERAYIPDWIPVDESSIRPADFFYDELFLELSVNAARRGLARNYEVQMSLGLDRIPAVAGGHRALVLSNDIDLAQCRDRLSQLGLTPGEWLAWNVAERGGVGGLQFMALLLETTGMGRLFARFDDTPGGGRFLIGLQLSGLTGVRKEQTQ